MRKEMGKEKWQDTFNEKWRHAFSDEVAQSLSRVFGRLDRLEPNATEEFYKMPHGSRITDDVQLERQAEENRNLKYKI